MIDFRYHLVSIVAIFLALAVGIVMGTTLLQEPAVELAKKTSADLTKANNELRADLDALGGREAGNDAFVTAMTPQLVTGSLTGVRLVLVESPGATSSLREQAQQVVTQAGATVAGRITLTEKYVSPASAGLLDELAIQLKPADLTYPPGATSYDKAAMLLGATLMVNDPAQSGTPNPTTAAVLDGFEKAGFLSFEGEPAQRSTMALMFAPDKPYEGDKAELQAASLVALSGGLDARGKGTVLTGTAGAVGTGGVITELRDTSDLAKRVSTVDTLDMPAGRVVNAQALREQLNGRSGQYGIGTGASAFQPVVPTPTPTPSTSGS
ncbi:copper transporter [Nonomuraea sp. NBC_01738]|uniref:copper transporter n=1 Tax=Nonomuraea sp. NBC_01738 TaxID=2976003 RepID=UPI002E118064|nr:copper transporter [Nonomuraea sp. NBC_01738]